MPVRRTLVLAAGLALLSLAALGAYWYARVVSATADSRPEFVGEQAYQFVLEQMEFGPRPTGTEGSYQTGEFILRSLEEAGWETSVHEFTYLGTPGRNLIGTAGSGSVILLGAHYDTRRRADRDLASPAAPVPGANDGASGVAVLLELARALDRTQLENTVWLVFFDAEDNGGLDGWDWIAGSRAFAAQMTERPESGVIVDMVGDADQQIYIDRNSDPALSATLWAIAARLGYGKYFIPLPRHAMLDDHTPFAELGIPAVDIIDFDYPYWHTTQDTADKVSPESLERVGRVLEVWLEAKQVPEN